MVIAEVFWLCMVSMVRDTVKLYARKNSKFQTEKINSILARQQNLHQDEVNSMRVRNLKKDKKSKSEEKVSPRRQTYAAITFPDQLFS